MTTGIGWYELTGELCERAARYTALMERADTSVTQQRYPSSLFSWTYLETLASTPEPEPGQWWWIFAPWLHALLDGEHKSIAYLACLGYHVATTDNPTDDEIQRSWLHFVPSDVSADAQSRHLIACCVGHALRDSDFNSKLLRSTQLLEKVKPEQYLKPLLISFDDKTDGALVDWIHSNPGHQRPPLYCLNWSPFRSALNASSRACFHEDIQQVCGRDGESWMELCLQEPVPSGNHAIDPSSALAAIASIGGQILNSHSSPLGPSGVSCALADLVELSEEERNRVCNFVAWAHKVAPPDQWSHLLTIPLWLPPNKTGARDASAILYLRPQALQNTRSDAESRLRQHEQSVATVLGSSAAAMGATGFMAHDRARSIRHAYHRVPYLATIAERLWARSTRGDPCDRVIFLSESTALIYIERDGNILLEPCPFVGRKGWKYFVQIAENVEDRVYWWQLRDYRAAPELQRERTNTAHDMEARIEHLRNLFIERPTMDGGGPFWSICDCVDEMEFDQVASHVSKVEQSIDSCLAVKILEPAQAQQLRNALMPLKTCCGEADKDLAVATANEAIRKANRAARVAIAYASRKVFDVRGDVKKKEREKMRKVFAEIQLRRTKNTLLDPTLGPAAQQLLNHMYEVGSAEHQQEDPETGHIFVRYIDVPETDRFAVERL